VFDLDLDLVTDFAVALLIQYSFELRGQTARELVNHWIKDYPASWVYQSVIEALYQGRYKVVSVEQILAFWQRRGQAMHHYNYEFERLVCNGFPQMLAGHPHSSSPSGPVNVTIQGTRGQEDKAQPTTGVEVPPLRTSGTRGEQSNPPLPLCPTDMPLLDTTIKALPTNKHMGEKLGHRSSTKTSNHDQQSRWGDNYCPIQQFTPPQDSSEFYTKLKAISKSSQDDPEQ